MAKEQNLTFLKSLFLTLTLAAGLVACQKSGDNQASVPPPPYVNPYGTCPTCYSNSTALLNAVQTQTAGINGVFDIIGDPAAGANNPDPQAILYYRGSVQIVGRLTVTTPGDATLCWATPGQYVIRPQDNGLMNSGALFEGMRISADAGNARFTAFIVKGVVTNAGSGLGPIRGSNTNRLGMTLMMESANGQACPTTFLPIEFF